MQTSHGALGVCVDYKRGNGIPFPSCILVILVLFGGGREVGGGGGCNYVTWTRHMTIVPLK